MLQFSADGKTLQIGYDAEGNRTSLMDANGASTLWQYDGDGRAIRKTYVANGTTEQWNYNGSDGRLMSSVNARLQTTSYGYTPWDEVTNVNYPTTTSVSFGRDGLGRMTKMTDGVGTTNWVYDSAGRPSTEYGLWYGDTVAHSYDSRNNISQTTVGSNNGSDIVNYGYDSIGRLNAVSASTGNWGAITGVRGSTWNMAYVGWSQTPLTQDAPNRMHAEWNYEAPGNTLQRLTRITNAGESSAVLSRFAYSYGSGGASDPRDDRTSVYKLYGNNPAEAQTTTYNYNATSMLTSEAATAAGNAQTPAIKKTYGYDAMGNRTNFSDYDSPITQGVTSSYNSLNQITQSNVTTSYATNPNYLTTSYAYDSDGNTASAYTTNNSVSTPSYGSTYTYDEENRLTAIDSRSNSQIMVPDSRYEFVYDGLSRLCISRYYTRQSNGQLAQQSEIRRVYDGMDVVQERDQNNLVTASYTRTGNIGGILARTSATGSVFYGYDGGGNVTTLTNSSDAVVGSYTYDAYGNSVYTSGTAAFDNPYRFSTKESIGGLYSYGFRFYSPGLGRWINRDPISEAGGTNLYGFVGNDPVNMVDTNGMLGIGVQITVFHRDFTLSTPGYGHFGGDLLFDKSSAQHSGNDIEKGWYAGADGLNPLGSPYKDLGYYCPCDEVALTSFRLGKVSQLSFAAAGGVYAAQAGWLYNAAMGSAKEVASNIATSAAANALGGVLHRAGDKYLLGKNVNPLDRQAVSENLLSGALGGAVGLRAAPAGGAWSAIGGGAAGYGFGDWLYQGATGWTP